MMAGLSFNLTLSLNRSEGLTCNSLLPEEQRCFIDMTEYRCQRVNTLLRVRDVTGVNLGPETGCQDSGFRTFPQFLQADVEIVSLP